MNFITSDYVFSQIKRRAPSGHKGSFGSVLCVAGSSEYRGAAALCALGALRCGAGLVTLASGENVIQSVAAQILEATFLPLPSPKLFNKAQSASCVVLGCGMHDNAETAQLTAQILPVAKSIVLDAGALCSVRDNLKLLKSAEGTPIITPHPGEMARLCGKSVDEIQLSREQTAVQFAKEHGCVVVLKGRGTIVADKSGEAWQNCTGNAGLARGGSGDILSGMIGALMANGLAPLNAAICAVYLHGHAADLCAARLSAQGMLPHDILTDLCTIFKENGR